MRQPFRREGGPRPPRREGGPEGRKPFQRKKVCNFCKNPVLTIDYKDARALRPYLTERGRVMPRRISGACAKHQRVICTAIKRARNIAILPFTAVSLG